MYDKNHRLTRAGMEQVIREGGSVHHQGQVITRLDQLPDDTQIVADHMRSELDALERARNIVKSGGTATFGGKHVNKLEDLPSDADVALGFEGAEGQALAALDEQQRRLDEQRDRLSKAAADRAKAAKAQAAQSTADEEEPTFHGKPLSAYDKYADSAALQKIDGIGEKTADDILAARAKRDKARK